MKKILTILYCSFCILAIHAQEQDSIARQGVFNRYGYNLHQGMNINVDLSAFYLSGKHLHGGGFGQRISATYLKPLTEKLWVAAGGYLNNTLFKGDSFRNGGIYGMFGYKFNEHWEAYLYAQKSITNNYYSRPYFNSWYGYSPFHSSLRDGGIGCPGADVLGATIQYNFNPSFSVAVSIEGVWYKNNDLKYPYQYNYPTPQP